jgi:hypothetical protein
MYQKSLLDAQCGEGGQGNRIWAKIIGLIRDDEL